MSKYKIVDGKVNTRALEYHVVDHCNLSCDHCCSFSPFLKKWEITPEELLEDLSELKKYLRPDFLKIVGGEPTLHSNLEEILHNAKKSQISSRVTLTTNGMFLEKISDRCWSNLDRVTISLYLHSDLDKEKIKRIAKLGKKHNVGINWKVQDQFVQMNREALNSVCDSDKVFEGCWIHHRCHSIREGVFYCCTRTQYLKSLTGIKEFELDGLQVYNNENDFVHTLCDYLNRQNSLKTCQVCKGGQAELSTSKTLTPDQLREKRSGLKELCQAIFS